MPTATHPGQRHLCPTCDKLMQYSFRFDTHYCSDCKKWIEPKCENPKCIFCDGRPEKPPEGE